MKTFLINECDLDTVFQLVDPTSFLEIEFEAAVVRALKCVYPQYWCGVFSGTFQLNGKRRKSDLALIHNSFSHWFVIEVELAGHSLEHHVIPQVRCFKYGKPESSCINSLTNAFPEIKRNQAARILEDLPLHVAVVGNLPNEKWTTAMQALGAQHLTVSVYRNGKGIFAYEVEGQLIATEESIGFAKYSAIDDCFRISSSSRLPVGQIQLMDQFGQTGTWTVREYAETFWVSKNRGPTLLDHNSYIQLVRTQDGRILLKPTSSQSSSL